MFSPAACRALGVLSYLGELGSVHVMTYLANSLFR